MNALTVVTKGTNMRDVLKKVEHWEQQWAKYELESGDTLSLKLKTGVLLKMLPPKEEREIKLRYVDRPGELSYEVLRRQVENWIDNALDGNGPAPMDVGNLETADAIEALEAQLLVLRERKGKGKERGKGKAKGKGGKAKGKITTGASASGVRQIKGNCWTCGETGHSAAQCTKRKGLSPCGKEEEEGEDDDDDDSDTESGTESCGMLGLGSLELEEPAFNIFILFLTLIMSFIKSCIMTSGTSSIDNVFDVDLSPFGDESEDDGSESEDDGELNEEDAKLEKAIKAQLEMLRSIEDEVDNGAFEVPKKTSKAVVATIHGTQTTVANSFQSLLPLSEGGPFRLPKLRNAGKGGANIDIEEKIMEEQVIIPEDNLYTRHLKRMEEAGKSMIGSTPSTAASSKVTPFTGPPGLSDIICVRIDGLVGQAVPQTRFTPWRI